MDCPRAEDLLDAYDAAAHSQAPFRAVAILSRLWPMPAREAAALPLGERDRRLMLLRENVLGGRLEAVVCCPGCGTGLELSFALRSIVPQEYEVPAEIWSGGLTLRPPNSTDLIACMRMGASERRKALFMRCLTSGHLAADELSDEVIRLAGAALAEADPQACLLIDLHCPDCSHLWQSVFDPLAFFWSELQAFSKRLLSEVHQLARHYGWSQSEILALTPARRRAYLQLLRP